ncbi:MAG: 50S ribosomal protein L11 [Thaumarchaeota archaeon]|nr:50S ribosomal protein L11 [Nitrososphaerota archaeon]
MGEKKVISALIVGGEVTAGPPLGPALGPLGVNIMQIVKEINELTKDYAGMRVPVKLEVDQETKKFEIEVGLPTTSALIVKEAGIEKGSGTPHEEFVGSLSLNQVLKIAKAKTQISYGTNLKAIAKEIIGSCVSMGVKIDEKDPRAILESEEFLALKDNPPVDMSEPSKPRVVKAPEEKPAEDKASEEKASEDKTPEEKPAEDKAPDPKAK